MSQKQQQERQHTNHTNNAEIMQGLQNAICAGIFASLSSVCGKLMSNYDTLPVKIGCIGGIVACTVLMIGFMTRSMKYLSTLTATVTNTASNFIITVRLVISYSLLIALVYKLLTTILL